MLKFVCKVDSTWHNSSEEMPPFSTDVEFMDNGGNIHEGKIQVDIAGHYAYLKGGGYSSFSIMVKWRFIPNRKYPMYEGYK